MAWRPFRNVGLKMTAVALGALLWFTVSGERVERKVPRVPIYYRNLPASLEITEQPDSVDVSVRGKYADVSRIQDIAITADLGGAGQGANVLPLRVDQVTVPPGVEVMQIDPGTVTVWLERSDVLNVPIRPNLDGEPAPGYRVREYLVEPAVVTIVGPQSRLKPTTIAVTERISIEGAMETLVQVVSVGVGDAQLRLQDPITARVTVFIEPEPIERTLGAVPVSFSNLAAGRRSEAAPATVAVVLRGPKDRLDGLDRSRVTAHVDLNGLRSGTHTLAVRVNAPPGFEVIRTSPAIVSVSVR
jgi:YbbR domain-containing protein